jgi:hypothetical protein
MKPYSLIMRELIAMIDRLPSGNRSGLVGTKHMYVSEATLRMALNEREAWRSRQTRKKKAIGRIINSLQQPR